MSVRQCDKDSKNKKWRTRVVYLCGMGAVSGVCGWCSGLYRHARRFAFSGDTYKKSTRKRWIFCEDSGAFFGSHQVGAWVACGYCSAETLAFVEGGSGAHPVWCNNVVRVQEERHGSMVVRRNVMVFGGRLVFGLI